MKKKSKKLFTNAIVLVLALAAIVQGIFLVGVKLEGSSASSTIALVPFIFGGAKIKSSASILSIDTSYKGGLSYFGLASLIVLVLGIALVVLSMFSKKKKSNALSYVLLVVAGVLIFFIKFAGADVGDSIKVSFVDFFEEYKFGISVYIYAVLSIASGLFGLVFSKK